MLLTHTPTLCQKGHGPYVHIGGSDYLGEYHEFDWFCGGYDFVDDYGNAHYQECDAEESLPVLYAQNEPYRETNELFLVVNESAWDEDISPWYYRLYYWTDGTF